MKWLILSLILLVGCNEQETQQDQGSQADQTPVVTEPDQPTDVVEPTPVISAEMFSSPWKDQGTTIVIDAYQGNSIDWDKMASDKRMVAVIHRFAYGTRKDSKYDSRKTEAKKRGYMWGAYHLPLKGNTIAQAKMFVEEMKASPSDFMALDLEDTTNGTFMTLDEAKVFMEYVYKETGRIPVIYANHSTTLKLNAKFKDHPIISKAQLWYARFKSKVTDFPSGIWNSYFLWQFSSEINCNKTGSCLYNVPGTNYGMDINVFYGGETELRKVWAK